jgi:ferredoxin-thioredoxin reductase catalytic subunit
MMTRKGAEKYAAKMGFELGENADEILEEIAKKNGGCPCRIDSKCLCKYHLDDIKAIGHCHCGLFVDKNFLTNEEKYDRLFYWQMNDFVHGLTCSGGGGDCSNEYLIPKIINDEVILECPKCGRIQKTNEVPDIVFKSDLKITSETFLTELRKRCINGNNK